MFIAIARRNTTNKLTKFRVLIFSILRIHSLHLVTSPDYTYSKGYLGLYSELGALLSIITCSGLSALTLVAKLMKRPLRLDQYQDQTNLRQVGRTTASQMSTTIRTKLEHLSVVDEQKPTSDQESIENSTSVPIPSRLPADISEAAAGLTISSTASTQHRELPDFYWNLSETNLALVMLGVEKTCLNHGLSGWVAALLITRTCWGLLLNRLDARQVE